MPVYGAGRPLVACKKCKEITVKAGKIELRRGLKCERGKGFMVSHCQKWAASNSCGPGSSDTPQMSLVLPGIDAEEMMDWTVSRLPFWRMRHTDEINFVGLVSQPRHDINPSRWAAKTKRSVWENTCCEQVFRFESGIIVAGLS